MRTTAKLPARRMGPEGSATWNQILDGAEELLRDEGYASLTSRRVAERAGVKQQLVYYYFSTMDDLAVEAFRRLSTRELERIESAVESDRALHDLWDICTHLNNQLVSEFMALANRSQAVQKEVILFIEQSRQLQAKAITRAIKANKRAAGGLSPAALAFLATSVALALTRESALGITKGHRDLQRFIEQSISDLELD